MSKLLKEWNRLAFGKNNRSLNESIEEPMHESGIPMSLWEMSDYEEAIELYTVYEALIAQLQTYSDEHLEIKVDQLRKEIKEDMEYMDDPQNQYDSLIYPKEQLINVIVDIKDGFNNFGTIK